MKQEQKPGLTRRDALKGAVALLGGTITAAQLGLLRQSIAAVADDAAPRYLDSKQLETVTRIVDIVIPETDTPGAVSAGVPKFIDLLLSEWASTERQKAFIAGLGAIDDRAQQAGADSFIDSDFRDQVELLRSLDREAFADGAPDTFFRGFKKLILFAYFSSKPGATQALRFDPFPGNYEPCLPLGDDDRAWFWLGYSYDL